MRHGFLRIGGGGFVDAELLKLLAAIGPFGIGAAVALAAGKLSANSSQPPPRSAISDDKMDEKIDRILETFQAMQITHATNHARLDERMKHLEETIEGLASGLEKLRGSIK